MYVKFFFGFCVYILQYVFASLLRHMDGQTLWDIIFNVWGVLTIVMDQSYRT